MLDFLGQNVNQLPASEIQQYSDLVVAKKILGNFHRSPAKAPSEDTKVKFYQTSGGFIGTSKTSGRKKDERIRTPMTKDNPEGRILPVLGVEGQKKGAKVDEASARFGLMEREMPGVKKKFDASFKSEYDTMISGVATKMFTGLKGGQKMSKAFSPQELGADAEGPVKGAVFESFIRGMIKKEKQVAGQAVDITK